MVSVSFLCSSALFVVGAALQQLALFRRAKQYTSLPEDCRGAQSTSLLLFSLGLASELAAFVLLPLATVTILGSVVLLFFTVQLAADEERPLMAYEKRGIAGIVIGCVLILGWGGEVRRMEEGKFDEVFNITYFLWMLGSLTLNCTLRRLGFYEGRSLLESCIPAQITALGIGALKFMLLALAAFTEDWYVFSVGFAGLVALGALHTSSAFLGVLQHKHDRLVTMGSYYVWLIMYQLPLGVTVLGVDVEYTIGNYVCITLSATFATAGAGYISYVRSGELESDSKEKKQAYASTAGKLGKREDETTDEGRLIRT